MDKRFLIPALAAAIALAACSGKQQNSSSSTTTTVSSPAAASPAATIASASAASTSGAAVYNSNCSSCHQPSGKGLAGAFPPLAGNAVVTGDANKVIGIVKNGLHGVITVNGKTYNGQMPSWKTQLKPEDIASVVSYIRSSWGNKASAVTVSQVNAVK